MADYVAPVFTTAQAREAREALKRWWAVKSMVDGPGRDMHAARAALNAIAALDRVLPDSPAGGLPAPEEGHTDGIRSDGQTPDPGGR